MLVCDSFSKTLAPGYRVGWVAPGKFLAQIEHLKLVTTVATAPLANGGYDHHLRKLRRLYAEKVQSFSQAVTTHFPEGTRLTRPLGGYVLWVELPSSVSSLELLDRALAAGISIAPGPMFSAKSKFLNFIRLNCGNPWSDRIEDALKQLGRMVHAMSR